MALELIPSIILRKEDIPASGIYLDSVSYKINLCKFDHKGFSLSKNILAFRGSNINKPDREIFHDTEFESLGKFRNTEIIQLSDLRCEYLLIINENQLKFKVYLINSSIYLEECDKINSINEVLNTEFQNIIVHLDAQKSSNLKQLWINQYIKFLHSNDLILIQKILPKIYSDLYPDEININTDLENFENGLIVFRFSYPNQKFFDIDMVIELRYEQHWFHLKCDILFLSKDLHSNLKKVSKIIEYLKKQVLIVKSLNGFKKLEIKLKSFRLGTDSDEIYKEIQSFLIHYKEKLDQISKNVSIIWDNDKIQEKEVSKTIETLLKNSEQMSSLFLKPESLLGPQKPFSVQEQSFNIRLSLYFLIADICEPLIKCGLCLKKSNLIFDSFNIKNSENIDNATVFQTKKMIISQICILKNLRIEYVGKNYILILSELPQNFDKSSYLSSMYSFLTKLLFLPSYQDFYKKVLASDYSIVSYPAIYTRTLYSIYSTYNIPQVIRFLEFIEYSDRILVLVKSTLNPIPKKNILEFFVVDLFELIKNLAINSPHILSIDPSCLFTNSKGKLKVMIKPLEEIDDFYKAPEVLAGRSSNESILFSYGKIIDFCYLKENKHAYAKELPLEVLNSNEQILKQIVIELTKPALFHRADLGKLVLLLKDIQI